MNHCLLFRHYKLSSNKNLFYINFMQRWRCNKLHPPSEKLKVKKLTAYYEIRRLIRCSKRADITQFYQRASLVHYHNVIIYFLKLDVNIVLLHQFVNISASNKTKF
jgi:hypothetical protein